VLNGVRSDVTRAGGKRGRVAPSEDVLYAIARVLRLSPSTLRLKLSEIAELTD
jgi:hypothetical protein